MFLQQSDPFFVKVVQPAEHQTTVLELFLGSLGITILAALTGLILGAVLAVVLVRWNRRHPPDPTHLLPVSPLVPGSPPRP